MDGSRCLSIFLVLIGLLLSHQSCAGLVITDKVYAKDGRVWAQVDLFLNTSWNSLNQLCPAGTCSPGAEINGWSLDGWLWASAEDVQSMFNAYTGQNTPALEGYLEANSMWGPQLTELFNPTLPVFTSASVIGTTRTEFSPRSAHLGSILDDFDASDDDWAGTRSNNGKDNANAGLGAWFVHSVPLPSTLLLLAVALFGLRSERWIGVASVGRK